MASKIIYLKLPFDLGVLRYTYLRCTEAVFTKSTLQMQACTLQIFVSGSTVIQHKKLNIKIRKVLLLTGSTHLDATNKL